MSTKPLFVAAAVVLVTGASVMLSVGAVHAQPAQTRPAAPSLTVKTIDGKNLSLADLKGKVVLINFWATWCSPCRAEIPWLVNLQNRYRDDLAIVGLSLDEGPAEAVHKFAGNLRVNYPIAIVSEDVAHRFGEMIGLPTTYAIDRTGRVAFRHTGLVSPESLEREVRTLAGIE